MRCLADRGRRDRTPSLSDGRKVSERASAALTRSAIPARWRGYTGMARTARNGVFGRVEAYDSVPATIDEIDPDRSYDEVAAVGREGIDR